MAFAFDPAVLVSTALLVGFYFRAVRILARRGYAVRPRQQVAWYTGVALITLALVGPTGALADRLMVEHLLIADLAAPLLLVGLRTPVLQFLLPRPALVTLARRRRLRAALRLLRDFPFPNRRSLRALAQTLKPGPQVGLAGSVLLPGVNRVAFGLIGQDQKFVYGPSALYLARSPSGRARGPFLAPADSFVPDRAYLSRTAAADTADIKAIYATQVRFERAGRYAVLAVSRVKGSWWARLPRSR